MRFLLLIVFPLLLKSQDTLYLANKTREVGKVLEIGTNNVSYNRASNPQGPVFIKFKSEIDSIRYENGAIERLGPRSVIKHASKAQQGFQYLTISKNEVYYHEKVLNEAQFKKLILQYPNAAKKEQLLKSFHKMRKYKKRQYNWGIAGPSSAAFLIGLGTLIAVEETRDPGAYVGGIVITGAIIAGVSLTQSQINKRKRAEQKIALANLYNSL